MSIIMLKRVACPFENETGKNARIAKEGKKKKKIRDYGLAKEGR
jgi:hypothetical protein